MTRDDDYTARLRAFQQETSDAIQRMKEMLQNRRWLLEESAQESDMLVRIHDGTIVQVTGRAAQIISMVARTADRINAIDPEGLVEVVWADDRYKLHCLAVARADP